MKQKIKQHIKCENQIMDLVMRNGNNLFPLDRYRYKVCVHFIIVVRLPISIEYVVDLLLYQIINEKCEHSNSS